MTEFLVALGKNHKEWVQIAKNLGAKDYAEDIASLKAPAPPHTPPPTKPMAGSIGRWAAPVAPGPI